MEISEPTLLVWKNKLLNNLKNMMKKAETSQVDLRPHFKTHQSIPIGNILRNEGISKITVSSISMAQQFANAGWNDICIAFPVNILEIEKIRSLAEQLKNLYLLVESVEAVKYLIDNLHLPVNLWIKIDVGNHRT
ncbi:MAG: alanine racemase, partial [Candidatus Heimdallarchaeota archaeon]|nr:alanine racemase [Candidatus Heimdallarchaeota archaeon]